MGLFAAGKCALCSEPVKLWDKAASLNRAALRCGTCREKVRNALDRFANEFRAMSSRGQLDPQRWQALWRDLYACGVTAEEGKGYIHTDSVQYLESFIVLANADGIITPQEEQYFEQMIGVLIIHPNAALDLRGKWFRAKQFSDIQRGILPTVQTDIHLEAGEICHLDIPATYEKVTAKNVQEVPLRIIATNRKIHVLVHGAGGWNIQYNSIQRVTQSRFMVRGALTFELAKKQGAGTYFVHDSAYAHLIITTLVKIWRREIVVGGAGNSASRHIPQHVKIAVFQRDGGKCVQCGDANYLEFDHIIPFSRGGASTEGNVQLLCRRCNGEKGDRI